MSDNEFEDFDDNDDPGEAQPIAQPNAQPNDQPNAEPGAGSAGRRGRRAKPIDDEWDELDWEELDWEEMGFEDLGYEPEDADRVREAWRRINREYGRRGDLPGIMRMFSLFNEVAGEAVSPETRRQFERVLRDFLVILRDVIDRAIDRLEVDAGEVEIEEIPID